MPTIRGRIEGAIEAALKMTEIRTQGEIEASICTLMVRFEQEYMGRGPKDVRAYLDR